MRDVNDTRYYMCYGEADWRRCLLPAEPCEDHPDGCLPPPDECLSLPDDEPLDVACESTLGFMWDNNPADVAFDWSVDDHATLTLSSRIYPFPAAPADNPVTLDQRRGAAYDAYGNVYWIDPSRQRILVQSSGTRRTAPFWDSQQVVAPPAPKTTFTVYEPPQSQPMTLQGLTVTTEHYLVVGVLEPAGLLIFDLHGPNEPLQQVWGIPFVPFDMAAKADGGFVVLDRNHKRYWHLNRQFKVMVSSIDPVEAAFQPHDHDASARQTIIRDTALQALEDAAITLPDGDPIAIEVLPDGSLLILDATQMDGLSGFYHYRDDVQVGDRLALSALRDVIDEAASEDAPSFTLAAHDFVLSVPPDSAHDTHLRLFIIGAKGNQGFALFLSFDSTDNLQLQPEKVYYPVRLYGGKGLVVDREGAVFYDFEQRWLPLVHQNRPRYEEEGTVYTPIIDSQIPDCIWHRLMLDVCIPTETNIIIATRAANTRDDLLDLDFVTEPLPYQRGEGSELPFVVNPDTIDTYELLFQQAAGRYMQMRLHFRGNGVRSPMLRELRAYYPRFSYLNHYLPATFREDPVSASFLERFLANMEGMYSELEGHIAHVHAYFDPVSAPEGALDWLATWFGLAFDSRWEPPRKRFLLQHILTFYSMRGTERGLVAALRLAMDDCIDPTLFDDPLDGTGIRIVETHRTRQFSGLQLGNPTERVAIERVSLTRAWHPTQGRAILHERYRTYAMTEATYAEFPLRAPEDEATYNKWVLFARGTLGFVPTQDAVGTRWHDFLRRRYGSIRALNTAYGLSPTQAYASFNAVPWVETVPADGAPLHDWFAFESVVLAMLATAHRFTVLLPLQADDYEDPLRQEMRRQITRQIIDLEKPAHTIYDIRFYWAMNRIGEMRIGDEIPLDAGSRMPHLMPPFILGRGFTLANTLAVPHPLDQKNRIVSDRDVLD